MGIARAAIKDILLITAHVELQHQLILTAQIQLRMEHA